MHRAVEKETNRSWLVRFVKCTVVEKMMIRQEIEILSDLNHPNILRLYDAYELDGEVAYVFELWVLYMDPCLHLHNPFQQLVNMSKVLSCLIGVLWFLFFFRISGCDLLSKMVSHSKPLHSEINCIKYMRQICQAVSHMHKHNVVNVDIRVSIVIFQNVLYFNNYSTFCRRRQYFSKHPTPINWNCQTSPPLNDSILRGAWEFFFQRSNTARLNFWPPRQFLITQTSGTLAYLLIRCKNIFTF